MQINSSWISLGLLLINRKLVSVFLLSLIVYLWTVHRKSWFFTLSYARICVAFPHLISLLKNNNSLENLLKV